MNNGTQLCRENVTAAGIPLGLLLPSKMGTLSSPETSTRKYQSTLRDAPEHRRSLLYRGGSLKFRRANQVVFRHLITKFTEATK